MIIPHKFNRMGISKSGGNIEKGLIFHAPLQENYDAIGGTLYNNPANYGWIFQTAYFDKPCVYGSTSTAGIQYIMDNPISGTVPFTMSIEFCTVDFTIGYGRSLFYIGTNIVNQAFGFEFAIEGHIGTAWGDGIVYDNEPQWRDYVYQWTTFTATYDLQRIKIYFNGELKHTSDPVTLNITKNGSYTSGSRNPPDLYVGSRWFDQRYWKNGLRNQYVYNYALSDQEVKAFYEITQGA